MVNELIFNQFKKWDSIETVCVYNHLGKGAPGNY